MSSVDRTVSTDLFERKGALNDEYARMRAGAAPSSTRDVLLCARENASLASEGTAFEARCEAVVKKTALRDGLVLLQALLQAGRRHLVVARLRARFGVEGSCQAGRERFLAPGLRDVSLAG
jgi:hypothetical protein